MATAEDDWRELREATAALLNELGLRDVWTLVLPLLVCTGLGGVLLAFSWIL